MSPEFESLERRRESLRAREHEFLVSVEDLAQAGLFYANEKGKVVCHWCAGVLESWEEGDDAWHEHAR